MTQLKHKCEKIKLLILDVDGILTDGTFTLTEDGQEYKTFHAHDGLGVRLIQKQGVHVAVITGRKSKAVDIRMSALGVTDIYQGQSDKTEAYEELKRKYKIKDEECAYMGDDLPDWPVMSQVGFKITVPNATDFIKDQADWITTKPGGYGAVREACELITSNLQ
ncbi:MAG: HAD-IIIA family hydrolase [Gammaproteobacteria bacterium]|nr:HAD-IIIA family hydrolase [Gammaproteobacteria bacterium]